MNKGIKVLKTEDIIKGILNRSIDGSLIYIAREDDGLGIGTFLGDKKEYSLTDSIGAVAYQFIKGYLGKDKDCYELFQKMVEKYVKENQLETQLKTKLTNKEN